MFYREFFFCFIKSIFFFGELKIIYTFAKSLIQKHVTQCLITVFILATLIISSLGSKGLCYGYLKIIKKQIKLIYNPDENQDFFLLKSLEYEC